MSLKKELIVLFDNFASLLEFKGDNPFKINAFRNGANIIRSIDDDIESSIKSGDIKNVKGLGKGLLYIINEYYEKGYSTEYNELAAEIPSGILDFLKISGLGAKKIKTIYNELGISTIEDLEEACRNNKIASLKGFGSKTQEGILKEIERINSTRNLILQNIAVRRIDEVLQKLKNLDSIQRTEITGQFRRANEVIGSLDFLLLLNDLENIEKELRLIFEVKNRFLIEERMPELSGYKLSDSIGFEAESFTDIPLLFYCTSSSTEFEILLFHTTGSQEFINRLKRTGHEIKGEKPDKEFISNEFPYVIPEMREAEYFEADARLRANSRLSFSDFKGLLHFHSTYSDGQSTLEEMIGAAAKLGFKYCTVCDHSKAAFYANGLNEEAVLKQREEIVHLGKKINIPIFQGIECDILKDGELDYEKEFLSNFDFIVASVHSSFKMSEDEMTSRIIRAIENPYTDLIGHPTGRLLLSRAPYQVNIKKVIDACAANNVAVEINANPFRLDLDWRMIYYAREKGCLFSINPDAHSTDGINDIHYGIRTARKGGLQPEEVINCFEPAEFRKFLQRKVERKPVQQ